MNKDIKKVKVLLKSLKEQYKEGMEIIEDCKSNLKETDDFIKTYNDIMGEHNEFIDELDPKSITLEHIMEKRETYFFHLIRSSDLVEDIKDKILNCEEYLEREG